MSAYIKLDKVSLSVPMFVQRERRAKNWASMVLGAALDPPKRAITTILQDISFEAHEGDRIAIIGRNGAGKSTLLRMLNGVYQPTSGSVEVSGTCQALLNISLGFNGEATVRENIFLRGTAMDLGAASLRSQIEPILAFAGLQEKSSHRLRTLSAGQKMRLGFAISTSFQQDIILMDEWFGAGDSEFTAKAKKRMQSRVGGSKIVILASHSVGLLRDVCTKGVVLEQGRLVYFGDVVSALRHYHGQMKQVRSKGGNAKAGQEEGHLVYGCAESAEFDQDRLRLAGWMTCTDGSSQQGLAIEIGGIRYPAIDIERNARPDVVRHFGLHEPRCGFVAHFALPTGHSIEALGLDMRVLGGHNSEDANTPLRLAPAILHMLHQQT